MKKRKRKRRKSRIKPVIIEPIEVPVIEQPITPEIPRGKYEPIRLPPTAPRPGIFG